MKLKWVVAVAFIVCMPGSLAFGQDREEPAIRKRNPTGALLRSAIIPGWGQFYNKMYIKATIIALAESYLIYGINNDWRDSDRFEKAFQGATDTEVKARDFSNYEKARDRRNLKMWILAAGIFYSMFDAYVDAQLSDFDQRDKAYEVLIAPRDDGIQVALTLEIK